MALSRGSPRVGVTDHLALWSPDLPRRSREGHAAAARPARPLSHKDIPYNSLGKSADQVVRCAVSLSERTTAGPSGNQSTSHRLATSRCIRNSAAAGAASAWRTSVLIGVT